MNKELSNEIIIFDEENLSLEVHISPEEDTVWLTLNQIAQLFDKNKSTISRHINNIFNEEELDPNSTVAKNATVQMEGNREIIRKIDFYN